MTPDPMDRRNLLQRVSLLIGATLLPATAWPAIAAPTRGQLGTARLAVLTAFADMIVPATDTPGALAAKVPDQIDALLGTWATAERKAEIIGALDAIDVLARSRFQRSFAQLTPAERDTVLRPHDVAALKVAAPAPSAADAQPGGVGQATARPPIYATKGRPRYADPGYARLKELVVVLFYLSETALTHELGYQHDPGAWEPSIDVTPATRPWGGIGAN